MTIRSTTLVLLALSLMAHPAYADHGHGRGFYGARPPGMGMSMGYRSPSPPAYSASLSYSSSPNYGYQHMHGGRHFWGPFGLLVGSALLYSALQPRTTYTYESRTIYAPPPVTMYYAPPPAPVVQYYDSVPATSMTTVTVLPARGSAYSSPLSMDANAQPGPGASGAAWWYQCRNPAGFYPYITECPVGWEKVAPAPPPPAP